MFGMSSEKPLIMTIDHCFSYLLARATSAIGGAGAPSVRIVLVGSASPHKTPTFHKDPDPVIFSEILEFALSLGTPSQGQEAFTGFPHLQAYRLLRAWSLVELGYDSLAEKYEAFAGRRLAHHAADIVKPLVKLFVIQAVVLNSSLRLSWIS